MKFKNLLIGLTLIAGIQALATEKNEYLGVVNKADGTASFINLTTKKTDFTIPVGYLPHEITSTPDGSKVFVSNYGKEHVRSRSPNNHPGNTLTVIDMKTKSKSADISLGKENCAPHGMITSADGKMLYVTCEDRQEVLVIDIENDIILHAIPTQQAQSHMVVLSADESQAYTSNFSAGTVSVLDLKNQSFLRQIPVGQGIEGVSASPNSPVIYASSVLEGRLAKIDALTFEITHTTATDRSPVRVLPTPDGKLLVVNNSADGTVQIFDSRDLTMIKRIKVGKQPIGLVVPNNDYAYSANMLDNTVSIIDLKTLEVVGELKTGGKPDGIAYISF